MSDKQEKVFTRHPPALYVTFHGEHHIRGAAFDSRESAERYPGPRMYECASKDVICYVPAKPFCELVKEWRDRLLDVRNEGTRTEMLACIGDLEDLLLEVRRESLKE